jgi:tRNA pseudouridine65 synthase
VSTTSSDEATPPAILFRDEALVIVNKPAGLVVHRGWAREAFYAMTLVRDLVGQHVHPVHRLDRPTSGALVFALRREDVATVQAAFAAQKVHKRYLALVRGIPEAEGLIDHAIAREKGDERRSAQTRFRRLAVLWKRYAWVEAEPLTGRTHQIRRHLRHLSCPIIGDVKHGDGKHNRRFREELGLHRLALHAVEIALPHPHTGEVVRVHAPVTEDLAKPLREMGLAPELLL